MSKLPTLFQRAARALLLPAVVTLSVAALAGCGDSYDRTEFAAIIADPFGGTISVRKLDVHEGMIVKADVTAWNDDNERMKVGVRLNDPSIVEVSGVVNSEHSLAFFGKKVGRTQLVVTADDEVVLVIEADVVAQPTLP